MNVVNKLLEMRWKSRARVVEEWAGLSEGSLLSTDETMVDVNSRGDDADDLDFEIDINMESYETSIELGLMEQESDQVVTDQLAEEPIVIRAFDLSDYLCNFLNPSDVHWGYADPPREELDGNKHGGDVVENEVDGCGYVLEEDVDVRDGGDVVETEFEDGLEEEENEERDGDSDSELCNFEVLLSNGESDDEDDDDEEEHDVRANVKKEDVDKRRENGVDVGRNLTKVEMKVEMADVSASSRNLRRSGRLSAKSQGSRNAPVACSIVVKVKEEDNCEADVMIVEGRGCLRADSAVEVVVSGGNGKRIRVKEEQGEDDVDVTMKRVKEEVE
ncbi:hypothetical protein HDU76_013881 [Blyttiomyces sp. JEL0837]|nr:hypothetical protein HDU76_013881 [Blyttiomyces sp. JEL0837]